VHKTCRREFIPQRDQLYGKVVAERSTNTTTTQGHPGFLPLQSGYLRFCESDFGEHVYER
jgi:hypothetical protein